MNPLEIARADLDNALEEYRKYQIFVHTNNATPGSTFIDPATPYQPYVDARNRYNQLSQGQPQQSIKRNKHLMQSFSEPGYSTQSVRVPSKTLTPGSRFMKSTTPIKGMPRGREFFSEPVSQVAESSIIPSNQPFGNATMTPDEYIAYLEDDSNFKPSPSSTPKSASQAADILDDVTPPPGSAGFPADILDDVTPPPGSAGFPVDDAIPSGKFRFDKSVVTDVAQELGRFSPYAVGLGLVADAVLSDDRLDRKVGNIAGNIIGAGIGTLLGGPAGGSVGALAGGWVSDRILNIFDPNDGKKVDSAKTAFLNQQLTQGNPQLEMAMLQSQLRDAQMRQKEMERQQMLQSQVQAFKPMTYNSSPYGNPYANF